MLDPRRRRNFLITTWEGGGSVGPALTVARKLIDAGHAVRVMCDLCSRPEAEATGARFRGWTRAPSRRDRNRETELIRDWDAPSVADGLSQAFLAIATGRAKDYADDLIEELRREPADLVIGSELILGVELACELLDQPCVVLACNSLMYRHPEAPEVGPPMTGEQREAMRPILEQLDIAFARALPPLNAARADFGLPPLASMWDQTLIARKTLIAISRTFDFAPATDGATLGYVGPQLDEVGWAEPWRDPADAGDDRPLILVSFSTTFQNHVGVLQQVTDAIGGLPVRALVTLGPAIAPEEIRAPANVRLLRSAPHGEVMKRASLVVTHGGHGTVARALLRGLPLLVLPHGRDQDGNAARVAAHGAGLALPPGADVETLRAALSALLDDPRYRRGAARLGAAIAREMRDCDVVAEIERLCETVPA